VIVIDNEHAIAEHTCGLQNTWTAVAVIVQCRGAAIMQQLAQHTQYQHQRLCKHYKHCSFICEMTIHQSVTYTTTETCLSTTEKDKRAMVLQPRGQSYCQSLFSKKH